MLDVIGFQEIAARAGTVALNLIAGLADDHVAVAGDNVTVPDICNKILAVYSGSNATAASLTTAVQLSSPFLMKTSLLDLPNFETNGLAAVAAALFPGNLADATGAIRTYIIPMNDFKEVPIQLKSGEMLQCLSSVDVAAVAEFIRVMIYLTDGDYPIKFPVGRIETIMADGSIAAVAGAWTASPMVLRRPLNAGTYALVGAKIASATATSGRFVFGNQGPRPGCPAVPTMRQSNDPMGGMFRYGRLGIWGTFTTTNPPVPQLICAAADAAAAQSFALDVIKIA